MTALAILSEPSAIETLPAVAEKISMAWRAYEAGDVAAAYALGEATLSQAKAASDYAARVKLGEDMRSEARRMVGLALEIATKAEIGLANEYERAEAAGLVSGRGRPKKGDRENLLKLENFGLTKERLHHIRKIREVETEFPGYIKRTITAQVESGFEPTRKNLRNAIGTDSAGKAARGDNFYQTPRVAVLSLLALESFTDTVLDPACGLSAITDVVEEKGYSVILSDLIDRGAVSAGGVAQSVGDFLESRPAESGKSPDIITNPPYGECLNAFVAHALRVWRPRKLALLLNLNFQCGFADDDRNFVMDENPPARVYVFKRRLPMMHREGYEGPKTTSRMNTAWFVWELQEDGTYGSADGAMLTRRIDWADYADDDCLEPGEGGHSSGIVFDEFARETPRRTLDERLAVRRDEALAWVLQQGHFDRGQLRRAIGIRDGDAEALISEFLSAGHVSGPDGEGRYSAAAAGQGTGFSSGPASALAREFFGDAAMDARDRELYRHAVSILHEGGDFSVAVLQERLGLGWGVALRLFDKIEEDHAPPAPMREKGRSAWEAEKKASADRKAKYRASFPAGVSDADLLAVARWNLEGYHARVMAGDVHGMVNCGDHIAAICEHLFGLAVDFDLFGKGGPPKGNGRFSCLAAARDWLMDKLAAPAGAVPMFGQPGRFLIELVGRRVDFRYGGLFGTCGGDACVVDLKKPFFSETGFRAFSVCPHDWIIHAGGLDVRAYMERACTEQLLHALGKKGKVKLHDGPFGVQMFQGDQRFPRSNDSILESRAKDAAWQPGGFLHAATQGGDA